MCTVTFVRVSGKTIITSNRDDQVLRSAIEPRNYSINNKNILYPKDPKAGGTWYAVDEKGTVLVLLNGAAEKHKWNPPYRKSRGIVVLDIISAESPIAFWEMIDLDGIEPFTIVLFEDGRLYQLRWNGAQKETVGLNPEQNHIWSSTTLYPKEIRDHREKLFREFLENKPNPDETEMFHFHRYTENGDRQNGLVIERSGQLRTLSITQTVIEKNKVTMLHSDLIGQKDFTNSFLIV
ncbi:MAG TPA: NRDE family protein [Flavobacterium sp.]|nr:NRDE family protein [Flavobacterium sp.]